MQAEHFDAVVIGGGIFGCYASLYLAGKGARVALLEKETQLFRKASLVNQARLHGGYHYPRSIATAALSDEHKERFTMEHRQFVHFAFEKYYAIDRFGSFTDAVQFERFCRYLQIPCERVPEHPLFNFNRLEALYRTVEYSFDPVLLGQFYRNRVEANAAITVFKPALLTSAESSGREWLLALDWLAQKRKLRSPVVINATYAATNAVNRLFGVRELGLTHELSEIAFITSRQFQNMGLTVMDGPFGSIMPYGRSGLLSLSSVAYTHHKISYDNLPRFDCQTPEDLSCRPEAPGICTECPRRPASNAYKMLRQMQQYFSGTVHFEHLFSYFTIKSKLKSSYIDDGRPTEISMLHDQPRFYCLFAGKVNSIYEIEKIV
ncbi:MAG: FAD-binding oxidoreductase [Saprospirales bacterium]|nr:FAD-binding oxidoreductase [Saprospirales bacterium]MBK8919955.1 FAD-binding oxidoreductase [Saprospirales bacterium]